MNMEEMLAQLTDEQKEELERICKEKGVSKSEFLKSVLDYVGKQIHGGLIDI